MRRVTGKFIIALFIIIFPPSCGGSDGDKKFDISSLSGDWFGTIENSTGGLYGANLTLDGENVSSDLGTLSISLSGILSHKQKNILEISFTNGIEAMLLTDDTKEVLFYVDEQGSFGVFQKNVENLPVYGKSDMDGQYSGVSVITHFITYEVTVVDLNCLELDISFQNFETPGKFLFFISWSRIKQFFEIIDL